MENILCTAIITFTHTSKEYDRLKIIASDVEMPSETYQGKTEPKMFWPIHSNYSDACKLVNGMTYLVTFAVTEEEGFKHPKLTLTDIEPIKNKLEARRLALELKSAQ
jgi:hypothetical protein